MKLILTTNFETIITDAPTGKVVTITVGKHEIERIPAAEGSDEDLILLKESGLTFPAYLLKYGLGTIEVITDSKPVPA